MDTAPPRTALVHDWLTGMRGGEKCLEVLCELYPDAPIHTLLAYPDRLSAILRAREIHTSFLQHMPGVERRYRYYLPLYPTAIRHFDFRSYDLILSSSHAVAKGVRVPDGTLHISYVHTPMRYIWDMFDQYFNRATMGMASLALIRLVSAWLRRWDVRTADSVHHFIANSHYVADRIRRIYGRESTVIHPPVDVHRFACSDTHDGGYLVVSALVPYKRVDLAIAAATREGFPLRIVGEGPERARLESLAGPTVRFDGALDDAGIADAYASCRALLFPGEEDFGIVPVEAMACGKPVIAFGRGGATESVIDGRTGLHFLEQTVDSLVDAVIRLEHAHFDAADIRAQALRFDREIHRERIASFVDEKWMAWRKTARPR
ncbi:MAG: glycosyltransferase [Bacteroidota bacterium]|jgi:glycosyltransferase involved in cell wall biosynthesis|nr:glycosyltransferase [Bacteroidota bacterium]